MITAFCKDCFKEYDIKDNEVLVMCRCGGFVFDRQESVFEKDSKGIKNE